MTDGIIQQAFKKLLTEYHDITYEEGYSDMPITTALNQLAILQQELIEKIKQEFPHSLLIRPDVQDKLIGDDPE